MGRLLASWGGMAPLPPPLNPPMDMGDFSPNFKHLRFPVFKLTVGTGATERRTWEYRILRLWMAAY